MLKCNSNKKRADFKKHEIMLKRHSKEKEENDKNKPKSAGVQASARSS